MSNDNKNKPQSTITKLIDYFNEDEEEEEEEEEINNNQKSEMNSFNIPGKFSRIYSMKDENEDEQNNNQNNSNNKNRINKDINNSNNNNNNEINDTNNNSEKNNQNNNQLQSKIFTTLYANEQPDSSFCCEERPKSINNNTEFLGRAVSFHPEDKEIVNKIHNANRIENDLAMKEEKDENDGQKKYLVIIKIKKI